MSANNLVSLYNPAEKTKSVLKNEFVVRIDSFDRIFGEIKGSKHKYPEQHYLIVGQRGAGKTTLLYRLKYAIEDDLSLNVRLIAINLGEEQYHVNSLADLWESICEVLDDYYGFSGLSSEVKKLRAQEGKIFDALASALNLRKKSLVLFIDNFGDLLRKLSEPEVSRLREVLMTTSYIRLIAGTPVALESVTDYSQPFFEFFKIIELNGLTNEETKVLLFKLAEIHFVTERITKIINERPERVEILRRLTGGVIRTMVLLFKIFTENEDGSSVRDLQLVLDSLTPLYKHRMDDLPTQQQKIVDVVARNWDSISVKELAERSKIPSKIVSAQLRQLEKNQIISKVNTDTKNNLYHLKERFFNIWYLMRYGRKYDRKRVIWLVRFFETWCDQKELEEQVKDFTANLASQKYDASSAVLMGEAYAACGIVSRDIKEKLIDTTASLYPTEFDKSKFDLDNDEVDEALRLAKQGLTKQALERLDQVKNLTEANYQAVVHIAMKSGDYKRVVNTLEVAYKDNFITDQELLLLGQLSEYETRNYVDAEKYYGTAANSGNVAAKLGQARVLYKHLKKINEAANILQGALNGSHDASVYHELGHLYGYETKEYEKAIDSFDKSISLGRIGSNFCLGALYHFELKDFEKAEHYYSVERNEGQNEFNLARLYEDLKKDYKKAVEYYNSAIKHGMKKAYFHLGVIYENRLIDYDAALENYKMAYKDANVLEGLHRMAHVYLKKGDFVKAENHFKRAIEEGDTDAIPCLAKMYFENNVNHSEAIELIDKAKLLDPADPFTHEVSANLMFKAERYDDVFKDLSVVFKDPEYTEREVRDITQLLIKLMSAGLYYPVLKLFQRDEFKLMDILKPVYFSLMHFLKRDFPNETLKMGEELSETVKEIVNQIEKKDSMN